MNTQTNTIYGLVPEGLHRISWGAVVAGLISAMALLWLMTLLGSAIGISILDVTDAGALGEGLGWGAIIWLVVSFLIAYYIGGAMAGRLSSDPTDRGGMLHGVTVWSTATVLSLILGAWGIGGTASVTTHVAGDMAKASTQVVTGTGQGLETAGQLAMEFADSELADEMAAAIKSGVAELLSSGTDTAGQQETRQAIEQIDPEAVANASGHLVAGEMGQAVQQLADATNLSRSEINSIITGLESEVEAAIEDSSMLNELEAELDAQLDDALAAAADFAGPALSTAELRASLNQLDAETTARIAAHLLQGEDDRARNVLTTNTPLSETEVNRVVDEVSAEFEQELEQWKQQAEEVIEAASDYTQMAIWSLFLASLLSLLAALFGGRMGAGRIRG